MRSRRILIGGVAAYLAVLLFLPLAVLVGAALSEGLWALVFSLADPDAWRALRLSMFLALGAVAINVVCGTAVAWVLSRHRFPGRRWLAALLDLPFALPPVAAGYMLLLIFGRQGYFRWIVVPLGFEAIFSWPAMFLATVFVTLPLVARQAGAVLEGSGRRQEEAAASLGAGPWDIFRRVTLPRIRGGILHGAALTWARALGEFGAVYVVGGVLRGYNETAPLFLARALEDRSAVAVGGVSLSLAGLAFLATATVEWFGRRGEEGDVPSDEETEHEH